MKIIFLATILGACSSSIAHAESFRFLDGREHPPLPEVVLSLSPDYSRIDLYPESIKADEMRAVMHCRGTVKIIDESTIVCWRAGAK